MNDERVQHVGELPATCGIFLAGQRFGLLQQALEVPVDGQLACLISKSAHPGNALFYIKQPINSLDQLLVLHAIDFAFAFNGRQHVSEAQQHFQA